MLPLENESGDPIEFAQSPESYTHNGMVYPVKKYGNKYVVIDQSRVLLLFMLLFQDMLSRKRINPDISFINHYGADTTSRYEI